MFGTWLWQANPNWWECRDTHPGLDLKGRHLGLVAGIGNFRVGQSPCALTLSLHLSTGELVIGYSRVGDMPWHPNPTPST